MPRQSDTLNLSGPISAQTIQKTLVPLALGAYTARNTRYIADTIKVGTNGTTEVNVFGTTNPVSGTFTGIAKIIPQDNSNGDITLQHTSAATVLFKIAKGCLGPVQSTYFAAAAFAADATATVVSTAGNAIVEIDFVAYNPVLNGVY